MTKARAEQLLAAAGPGGPWSAGEERTLSAYCAFARAVRGGDVTAGGLRAAGWADQAEATSALMQILAKRSHSTKRGGGAAGPKRGGGGFGEVRNLILLDTRSHRAALGTKAGDWLGVLAKHCAARFEVAPAPRALVGSWGFDAAGLRAQRASRILFTNGLNDGWSVGGFAKDVDVANELLVINMPNGAHHSDLSHGLPGPHDTPDVVEARANATRVLARWLENVKVL